MPRNWVVCALIASVLPLIAGFTRPAAAEFFGCDDQHPHHVSYTSGYSAPVSYRAGSPVSEHYAQALPPRVTIYPRRQVTRHCQSWLAKEYRVSGPVIVPRQRCWWQ
jgi:hypothetical protein